MIRYLTLLFLFISTSIIAQIKSPSEFLGYEIGTQFTRHAEVVNYFEYVAGSDTFNYNKPDPRHLTDVVEIIGGDLKKTIMVGDSEVDEMAATNAKLPFILVADGYTEKTVEQIKHDFLIKDYVGFDKIISKYL